MALNIRILTENGVDYIPLTHVKAVVCDDGRTLDVVVDGIDAKVTQTNGYAALSAASARNAAASAESANASSLSAQSSANDANAALDAIRVLLDNLSTSGASGDAILAQLAEIVAQQAVQDEQILRNTEIFVTEEEYMELENTGMLLPNRTYAIKES